MDEARHEERRVWFSDVFTETSALSSFLESVGVQVSQIAGIQFALAGPSSWRILLVCQLTPEQDELRRQWLAVEATLKGRKQELPTGGAH